MRFALLFLPWCFVPLALPAALCNWKMPTTETSCTQEIKWKVYDDNQATATCLEYFPTTFLEGKMKTNPDPQPASVACTVDRQFQCDFLDVAFSVPDSKPHLKAVSIFDKCYRFLDNEITMKEYMAKRGRNEALCKDGGGLPVLVTPTLTKHIGKEAHRRGIFKMWANVGSDGKTIDHSFVIGGKEGQFAGFLLYKDLWKVHDATYWNGETLTKTPAGGDPNAKYLFFRTNTDYPNNLWQGSFELATQDTKAHVVCEYPATIVPNHEKHCNKMKELGMNAIYDHRAATGRKKCLYTTLSSSPLWGTSGVVHKLPICMEKPYDDQSVGLDDGTASKEAYDALAKGGTYRVAAMKTNIDSVHWMDQNAYGSERRRKCDGKSPSDKQRSAFTIFNHVPTRQEYAVSMTSPWDLAYPKYECTAFPFEVEGHGNTLAIRNGEIIDVPVPVRFPAICSIASMVDCELHRWRCDEVKKTARGRKKALICENVDTWNKETKMYGTCDKCAKFHMQNSEGECLWTQSASGCAMVRKWTSNGQGEWKEVPTTDFTSLADLGMSDFDNLIDRVVPRNGCYISFYSHPETFYMPNQYQLLAIYGDISFGEFVVPNDRAFTLKGLDSEMSASAIHCTCRSDIPPVYSG